MAKRTAALVLLLLMGVLSGGAVRAAVVELQPATTTSSELSAIQTPLRWTEGPQQACAMQVSWAYDRTALTPTALRQSSAIVQGGYWVDWQVNLYPAQDRPSVLTVVVSHPSCAALPADIGVVEWNVASSAVGDGKSDKTYPITVESRDTVKWPSLAASEEGTAVEPFEVKPSSITVRGTGPGAGTGPDVPPPTVESRIAPVPVMGTPALVALSLALAVLGWRFGTRKGVAWMVIFALAFSSSLPVYAKGAARQASPEKSVVVSDVKGTVDQILGRDEHGSDCNGDGKVDVRDLVCKVRQSETAQASITAPAQDEEVAGMVAVVASAQAGQAAAGDKTDWTLEFAKDEAQPQWTKVAGESAVAPFTARAVYSRDWSGLEIGARYLLRLTSQLSGKPGAPKSQVVRRVRVGSSDPSYAHPVARIDTPQAGAEMAAAFDVVGTAKAGPATKWSLSLVRASNGARTSLGQGTGQMAAATLGHVDTAGLVAGERYSLELLVHNSATPPVQQRTVVDFVVKAQDPDYASPKASIDQPAEGQEVSGSFDVTGTARAGAATRWTLALLDGAGATVKTLATGTQAASGARLASVSTAGWTAGSVYQLQLTVDNGAPANPARAIALRSVRTQAAPVDPVVLNPVVKIESPATGAQLSGRVDVRGTANAGAATAWQLELLGAAQNPVLLGSGSAPAAGAVLGSLDTTALVAGVTYTLRLTADTRDPAHPRQVVDSVQFGVAPVVAPNAVPTARIDSPSSIFGNPKLTVATDITGVASDAEDFDGYELALAPVSPSGVTGSFQTLNAARVPSPAANGWLGRIDPAQFAAGTYVLRLRVADRAGQVSEATRPVELQDASRVVQQLSLDVSQATLLPGDHLRPQVIATFGQGAREDVSTQAVWTTSNAAVATVGGDGTIIGVAPGDATITVSYGGVTSSVTVHIVSPLADAAAPSLRITAPAEDTRVMQPARVIGEVGDPNLVEWVLSVAPGTSSDFVTLGRGYGALPAGSALGSLDTTVLENGPYTLRLTARDRGGNRTEVFSRVEVMGDAKIGLFSIGFKDAYVAALSLPLQVNRIYDSRRKLRKGDFGFGWDVSLASMRAMANRALGKGWSSVKTSSTWGVPTYTMTPQGDHTITVVPISGKSERFRVKVTPETQQAYPHQTGLGATLEPMDGALGKLEFASAPSLVFNSGQLLNDDDMSDFNPQQFVYTTPDGTRYEFHKDLGTSRIVLADGNTLTFGRDGVVHSAGQSIRFDRDAQDRITRITDANGAAQTYAYDSLGDLTAHTDPSGAVTKFTYDSRHALLEIRDPLGNRALKNEYDDAGRLIAQVDAQGYRTTYNYDLTGKSMLLTDANGHPQRFDYDDNGNVTLREYTVTLDGTPTKVTERYGYDANGYQSYFVNGDGVRTEQVSDAKGNQTLNVVDPAGLNLRTTASFDAASGKFQSSTDPAGRVTTASYDGAGQASKVVAASGLQVSVTGGAGGTVNDMTDPMGARHVYTRDGRGRIARDDVYDSANTLLQRTDFTYDANGNELTSTVWLDAAGTRKAVTTREYDSRGNVVRQIDPTGVETNSTYGAAGQLTAVSIGAAAAAQTSYDARGAVTSVTQADGSKVSYTYDGAGNKMSATDAAGRVTRYRYDELNREVEQTHPDGGVERTVYSAGGRVIAKLDALGQRTSFEYDNADRQTAQTQPTVVDATGGGTAAVQPVTRREYNALGQVTRAIDARGAATVFGYDALGRQTDVTFPDGSKESYGYDSANRRSLKTDALGRQTRYDYDALNRLVRVTEAAASGQPAPVTTYQYDMAGNLIAETDALGHTTRYAYDLASRLATKTLANGAVFMTTYDAAGRPQKKVSPSGDAVTMAYDAAGRMVTRTAISAGRTDTVHTTYLPSGEVESVTNSDGTLKYTYDAAGNVAQISRSDGNVLRYVHDRLGRLTRLISPSNDVAYAYDALGRQIGVTDINGTSRYGYDLNGNRVSARLANGASSDTVYDARNRPLSIEHRASTGALMERIGYAWRADNQIVGRSLADGTQETFEYDERNRLTREAQSGPGARDVKYTYDAVGNRVTESNSVVGDTTYQYDEINRLLATTGAKPMTFGYDADGRRTSRAIAGSTVNYEWNGFNQLARVVGGTSGPVDYVYDANGDRVAKVRGGAATRYLVSEINPTGYSQVVQATQSTGPATAYTWGTKLVATTEGPATQRFQHADPLGSIYARSDVAGAPVFKSRYTAFGLADSAVPEGDHRYNGEAWDTDAGAYYLRARYMDPSTGTFLTRDGFSGTPQSPFSLQPYQYVNNDPLTHADPSGNFMVGMMVAMDIMSNLQATNMAVRTTQMCTMLSRLDTFLDISVLAETGIWLSMAYLDGTTANRIDQREFSRPTWQRAQISKISVSVERADPLTRVANLENPTKWASLGTKVTFSGDTTAIGAKLMFPGISVAGTQSVDLFKARKDACGLVTIGEVKASVEFGVEASTKYDFADGKWKPKLARTYKGKFETKLTDRLKFGLTVPLPVEEWLGGDSSHW